MANFHVFRAEIACVLIKRQGAKTLGEFYEEIQVFDCLFAFFCKYFLKATSSNFT